MQLNSLTFVPMLKRLGRRRLTIVGILIPALLAAFILTWETTTSIRLASSSPASKLRKKRLEDAMMLPDNFHLVKRTTGNNHYGGKYYNSPPTQFSSGGTHYHFPRTISLHPVEDISLSINVVEPKRTIYQSKSAKKAQERLTRSDDFSYRDPLYEGDCVPMQPWQETSFPNCNSIHELDPHGRSVTNEFGYLTSGGYNDIFTVDNTSYEGDPKLVLKILQFGTSYTDRNFDRVRRDGLIYERLTRSKYILDSYGFCGFLVMVPYSDGGTLSGDIREWRKGRLDMSSNTRMKYAFQSAAALDDLHDIDGEGLSSVAHGDLKGQQYLITENGDLKLGDFNRGRFLRRNSTQPDTACTYTIGKNDATFRSPEEYNYLPETSAIDVWALGSILYTLLTGKEVWADMSTSMAQKYISKGKLPPINENTMNINDPVDIALKDAIELCWVFDPKERATAREVATFLQNKYEEIKPKTGKEREEEEKSL